MWQYMVACVTVSSDITTTSAAAANLISLSSRQDGQLPLILAVTVIVQYLGHVILFIASCVNDVPSRLQELTKTKLHTHTHTHVAKRRII